ncbi:sigma-70 family RNA polymerase sigma factor [Fulvivirgaceae bacterium BMA12]|uniref:Sigma-70 family RNA polymerase sigma factor n=1 Tax=Agaribacillus aureus TaxID=3051825 RepID=A0ABT8L1U0_9BACT|nr:sigma-70 family RNA polymerase sigma factor [Fulvivirgaceae bacterium BMA12]
MKTIGSKISPIRSTDVVSIERKYGKKNSYNWAELTDVEIWQAYKQGSKEAFIYIYKTYHQPLYNFGMQFCFNHEMVRDCIQETFFYLQKKSKDLSDVRSIKYYLYKILRRKLIAGIEEEKKYRPARESEDKRFEITISPELKLIDSQLDEERKSNLKIALNKLPERQREAILLFYYEGLTHDEVAQIMGLKADKYSRKLIYRGISTLRRLLISFILMIFGAQIISKF